MKSDEGVFLLVKAHLYLRFNMKFNKWKDLDLF